MSSPREWVEREAGDIHLWLSISPSLQNKQVIINLLSIYYRQFLNVFWLIYLFLGISLCIILYQVQIVVTPFRVNCGSTERHWVHCLGTDACIRRSKIKTILILNNIYNVYNIFDIFDLIQFES